MLEALNQNTAEILDKSFDAGYANAASALARMTTQQIGFHQIHAGFHPVGELQIDDALILNQGCLLLTTEIFGDITGKSYLFFSDKEVDLLTVGIPVGKDASINLKEEFLKEVDNILSASVITKLSNELKAKMYGDIPLLQGKTLAKIEHTIEDDFSEQTEKIYINAISFSVTGHPEIKPVFVWVLDSSVFESIKTKSII
jgi:chemotaxis protein CheY-P-specific phosphatase CheC